MLRWYNFLCIIFSVTLSNIDKREIGQKLFKSCVDPPLCSGITFIIFSFSGNIPFEKDIFMI